MTAHILTLFGAALSLWATAAFAQIADHPIKSDLLGINPGQTLEEVNQTLNVILRDPIHGIDKRLFGIGEGRRGCNEAVADHGYVCSAHIPEEKSFQLEFTRGIMPPILLEVVYRFH